MSYGALLAPLLALAWPGSARAEGTSGAGASLMVDGQSGLTLVYSWFHADVQLGTAVVDVEQLFHNPFDEPVNATYLFPLPPDAAVRSMSFTCGGREIEGVLLPIDQARAAFRQAADDGRKASLLEQERPNLFRESLASLCPNEDVRVDLQYVDPLRIEDGRRELVFPTTVGPRYEPGEIPEPPFTTLPAHTVELEVVLDEGLLIGSVWSDTHEVDISEDPSGRTTVVNDPDDDLPNKDFHLAWTFAGPEPQLSVVSVPPEDGQDGWLGLTLEPQLLQDLAQPRGRELLFVLDESCSMEGVPWDAERQAVALALDQMRPDDTFDLVRFSSDSDALFESPQPASPENREQAEEWLATFDGGGTEMAMGIVDALELPHDPDRLRLVLMLTDGYIGDEREALDAVTAHLGDARLFSLGVGSAVNRFLLDGLARVGRGDVAYHLPDTPIDETVRRFYDRIAHPALTDLAIDWGGLDVTEVYPSRLPDLFVGQPLRVVARYRGAPKEAVVTLTGTAGSEPYAIHREVDLTRADEHEALPVLWARRKIADLELTQPDERRRAAAITAVAMRYHLVSEETALVATDHVRSACGKADRSVDVPSMAPAGMSGGGSVGYGYGFRGKGAYGYGSGGGNFGAKGEGGIATVSGDPIVLGGADRTSLDRVIHDHLSQIRYCYQRELQHHPDLAGRVVIRFEIARSGTVSAATVSSSTVDDPAVGQCIAGVFLRMQFEVMGAVRVNYPFTFAPG